MATLRVVAIMLSPLEKWVFEKEHISETMVCMVSYLEKHLPNLCEVECLWGTRTITHAKFATHDSLVVNKPNGHNFGS